MLHRFGELPSIGSTIVVEEVEFIVEKIENNRIQELVVRKMGMMPGSTSTIRRKSRQNRGIRLTALRVPPLNRLPKEKTKNRS